MCDDHAHADAGAITETHVTEGRAYVVKGMTCEHCADSVTEEVSQVAGVTGVAVDLASGRVIVRGADFEDQSIHAAVDEAGYEVAHA